MSDFKQAIKWLKEGRKVRRKGKGFAFDTDYLSWGTEYVKHCRSEEEGFDWTLDDFEATDWEIYEEKNEIGITAEKLMNWISKSKIQGISPNILIISRPVSNAIRVCGKEILVNARPLIHTVMGIEIWVDDSIPKGKGYLFDKNTFIELEDGE